MNAFRLLCCSLVLLLICSQIACVPPTAAPQIIDMQPCKLGSISARCGSLSVFEDRAGRRGRKIDIHAAVIPARSENPAPDPIFYFAGGPGGSAIEDAEYALALLRSANQERDIVLVDQRGTGKSNKQVCPQPIGFSAELTPLTEQDLASLRACLKNLDADPAAYTTAWGVDDIDDVRAALGYDQINLYGESYGPTAEQIYLQRHGAHVRSVILEGVTLVDVPIFERIPRSSQAALDLLLARCGADPACSAAYPNLREELSTVIARVEEQPVDLPVTNPYTGKPLRYTREMMVLGIHSLLIATEKAVMLPYLAHQTYLGNWDVLAQTYSPGSVEDPPAWQVMSLNILCHEDWARMRPEETALFSEGSYLNYADIRRMVIPEEVCALFPRPRPEALYEPVTPSPVPVLIFINEADPQNPLENVAGAKERYPNSVTLVAPGQGHGYTGIACRRLIIANFFKLGTTEGLTAGCLQKEPLPPFFIAP